MSNLQVPSVTSLLKGPLKGSLEGPRNGARRAIFSPIGPMFLLSHSYQPLSSPEMKRRPDVKESYCRDAATNPICFERGVTTGNIVRYRAHKQGSETKPYQAAE